MAVATGISSNYGCEDCRATTTGDSGDVDARADSRGRCSRRQFVREASFKYWAAVGAAGGMGLPVIGRAEDSGPVDCGPPPRAKPQSRTGGESFPPLPLPATPLRRTEKKRPPAPPSLVGKMALGPVRFVRRGGERVQYRDWMTDPADLDSLLAWTNQKLGIHYGKTEADFEHFSFDPRELPALLFAGHNSFKLDDPVRQRLARYVLDGGTIIGDACCGWKDFNDSFRREMEAIFPGRPLRKLAPDDPLFSSYYKLGYFTYQKADGSRYEAEPCLEGITVGCRTGVVYSPADLTCGWDGHDHPRGLRVVIDQSRQIGANYVTYLLGSVPARPVPQHDQGLPRGRRAEPRRLRVRPDHARRGLGPRPVRGPQPAETRPRQLDAGHQVQAGPACSSRTPRPWSIRSST